MGRDQEVVKRSGREEPVWVAIHKCMEAMLGISVSQTSKNAMSFLSLKFSLQQNQRTEGRTGSTRKRGWGRTVYTHVSK
jgi:hypothetical protein